MNHCLVVDDSSSIRKVARRILEEIDFKASEAETRAEALDICRGGMPSAIIVDWRMPDGEAMAFMTKIRAMPDGKSTKIFYLTSENDPMNVARALRSGADAHMMKPFNRETFVRPFVEVGLV